MKGLFISFEGGEGSGKSSAITAIKNKLEADLMREICSENPEEGELIEQLLLLQRSKSLMQRRRGLKNEIESRLKEFVNKKKQ